MMPPVLFSGYVRKGSVVMLFNPMSKRIFDEEGRFLKKMSCPKGATAADLRNGACRLCDREVMPLDHTAELVALARLRANPDLCVSVSLEAPNVKVVLHDPS